MMTTLLSIQAHSHTNGLSFLAATEKAMPHFPDEFLIEIFFRLPVRSLLLFKSVSKHWLSLIQDPNFVGLHFNRPVSSLGNEPILVLRTIDSENVFLTMLSDDDTLPYKDDLPLEFFFPSKALGDLDVLHLLGPCNGLFCVVNMGDVVVVNPATRRCLKVDRLHRSPLDIFGLSWCVCFGYDDVVNDYKVVWFHEETCGDVSDDDDDDDDGELSLKQIDHHVVENDDDENDHDVDNDVYEGCPHGLHMRIEIYSLSTKTWREIRRLIPHRNLSCTDNFNVFFNSAFHWLHASKIFVFDLNKEAFKWFKLPDSYVNWFKLFDSHHNGSDDDVFQTYLSVLNESLAFTVHRKFGYWKNMHVGFEIWVMMEYGVHVSWSKQYNISPSVGIRRPLSFSKEGELLAEKRNVQSWLMTPVDRRKRELVLFNLKTRAIIKTFQVHGDPGSMQAFRYRESMVSLK